MSKIDFPIESWLLKHPLYEPIEINAEIENAIQAILLFEKAMDCYCPTCKQSATFRGVISDATEKTIQNALISFSQKRLAKAMGASNAINNPWKLPVFSKTIVCTRAQHFVHFHFISENNTIIKIGQFPSLADLAIGNNKQYKGVLGVERLKELNKAIGLAAHGVGIGHMCIYEEYLSS